MGAGGARDPPARPACSPAQALQLSHRRRYKLQLHPPAIYCHYSAPPALSLRCCPPISSLNLLLGDVARGISLTQGHSNTLSDDARAKARQPLEHPGSPHRPPSSTHTSPSPLQHTHRNHHPSHTIVLDAYRTLLNTPSNLHRRHGRPRAALRPVHSQQRRRSQPGCTRPEWQPAHCCSAGGKLVSKLRYSAFRDCAHLGVELRASATLLSCACRTPHQRGDEGMSAAEQRDCSAAEELQSVENIFSAQFVPPGYPLLGSRVRSACSVPCAGITAAT